MKLDTFVAVGGTRRVGRIERGVIRRRLGSGSVEIPSKVVRLVVDGSLRLELYF